MFACMHDLVHTGRVLEFGNSRIERVFYVHVAVGLDLTIKKQFSAWLGM